MVECFFEEFQPQEKLKCKLAYYALEGEAEQWWKQLQHQRVMGGESKITVWPRMKFLLINDFWPTTCSTKCPLHVCNDRLGEKCPYDHPNEFSCTLEITAPAIGNYVGQRSGSSFLPTTCSTKCTFRSYNSSQAKIIMKTTWNNNNNISSGEGSVQGKSKEIVEVKPATCSIKVPLESDIDTHDEENELRSVGVSGLAHKDIGVKTLEKLKPSGLSIEGATKHNQVESRFHSPELSNCVDEYEDKKKIEQTLVEGVDSIVVKGPGKETYAELPELKDHPLSELLEPEMVSYSVHTDDVQEIELKQPGKEELQLKSLVDWNTPTTKNIVAKETSVEHDTIIDVREYEEQKDIRVIIPKSTPLVDAHTFVALVVGKSVIVVEAQPYLSKVDLRAGMPLSVLSKMLTILLLSNYMVFNLSIDGITLFLFDPGGRFYLSHKWDFKNCFLSCSNILRSDGFVNSFENEVKLMMLEEFYNEKDKEIVMPVISEKFNTSSSPACNYVIENGTSAWDASRKAFNVPKADGILISKIQKLIKTNVDSQVHGFTYHINDLEFVKETYTLRCSLFGHSTNKPLVLTSALLDSAVQPWNVGQRKFFYNLTGCWNIGYSFADSPNNIGHGSLIIVRWTREVHYLLLLCLSKVHVIPVTFLFDPGGILRPVRACRIGLRNGILAEHVSNTQTFQRQCVWSSEMAMEDAVGNNDLLCLREPLYNFLVHVWLWYCLSKIHTKSSLLSCDSGMLVQMEKLADESTEKSFNSDDCGMQINEIPGHLISSFVAYLVGALPRYVDHAENIKITYTRRRLPCSVVLFDEVKRAQHVVFTLLLPVLDDEKPIWEWMVKKMEIGLSYMLLRVESDESTMFIHVLAAPNRKEFIMKWRETEHDYIFIHPAYSGIEDYSSIMTTCGRVIPLEGGNDENNTNWEKKFIMVEMSALMFDSCVNVLCKDGQSRESSKLFYNVVNGLDPPIDLDSACEASMWIPTSSLVDELF